MQAFCKKKVYFRENQITGAGFATKKYFTPRLQVSGGLPIFVYHFKTAIMNIDIYIDFYQPGNISAFVTSADYDGDSGWAEAWEGRADWDSHRESETNSGWMTGFCATLTPDGEDACIEVSIRGEFSEEDARYEIEKAIAAHYAQVQA